MAGGETIVSGSDAQWMLVNLSLDMRVAINEAVNIKGNYFIGSWNSPNYSTSTGLMVSSGIMDQDSPGVQRSMSPGYWRTLWVTAHLPWGKMTFGKRPAEFGMGLQYDGSDNRSLESLSFEGPYGPFLLGGSVYIARRGYATDDYGNNAVWYNERPDKNNSRRLLLHFSSCEISCGRSLYWIFL